MLLSLTPAHAAVIPVMDWSLDYGFCKASSPWQRRTMLEPVRAEPGDVVDIRYASRGSLSGRGVVRYPDEASWAACDEAQAVTIAADRDAGGGCSNSSDFRCLRATTGVEVPITGAPGDAVYLACPGAHCSGGLKLRVDVVAGRASVPPGAPRDIIVPVRTGACR